MIIGVPLLIVRQSGYSLWDAFFVCFFPDRLVFLTAFLLTLDFGTLGLFVFAPRTPRSHI